jgi:hypothetical protein
MKRLVVLRSQRTTVSEEIEQIDFVFSRAQFF